MNNQLSLAIIGRQPVALAAASELLTGTRRKVFLDVSNTSCCGSIDDKSN